MTSIDLASNSALLQVAEKLAEQNALLGKVAIRGESAFIRYSAYADGTDFTETWSAGQNYIGHATGLEAPENKEGYTWSLFASNIRETLTVTLKQNDWLNNTQIIETVQLGETGSVFPSPKPESQEAYLEAGIVISAATDNALVFTCLEVPEVDLVVDIQVTEPLAVIGGTGVSSWNELLDKPFDDTRRLGTIELTFDGNLEGREVLTDPSNSNMKYVKISNEIVEIRAFVGNTYKYSSNGEELGSGVFEDSKFQDSGFGAYYNLATESHGTFRLMLMYIPMSSNGIALTPGIWLVYDNGRYFSSIEFEGVLGDLHKLDKKYVHTPDWHAATAADGEIKNKPVYDYTAELGDTITRERDTVDDNDFLGLACLSHNIPSIEELKQGYFVVSSNDSPDQTYYLKDYLGNSFEDYDQTKILKVGNGNCRLGIAFQDGAVYDDGSPYVANKAGIYETSSNVTYILTGGLKSKWISEFYVPGFNFIREYYKKLDYSLIETPNWNATESEPGYIANRPFGNIIVDGNEVLTPNNLYDEKYTVMQLFNYRRNSKVIPTDEQLAASVLKVKLPNEDGEMVEQEFSGSALTITPYGENVTSLVIKINNSSEPFIFVVRKDNVKMEVSESDSDLALLAALAPDPFPKAGIYILDSGAVANLIGEFEIVSFTVPGATFEKVEFKPLGAEYISDEIARKEELTWDNLGNKPFNEIEEEYTETSTVTDETTVEWDGEVGDRVVAATTGDATYVKVSDGVIPDKASFIGSTCTTVSSGSATDTVITEELISEAASVLICEGFASILEDGAEYGDYTFPEKGLYFLNAPELQLYVSKFVGILTRDVTETKTRTIIETLDEKFIPDTIARASDLQALQDALDAYITDINDLIGGDE